MNKNKVVTFRLNEDLENKLGEIKEFLMNQNSFLNDLNTSEIIRALIVAYHQEYVKK